MRIYETKLIILLKEYNGCFESPQVLNKDIAFECALQAVHGILSLRLPGGRNLNDADRKLDADSEQVCFELGLGFILTGLAWEHDHERKTSLGNNRCDNGTNDIRLVLTKFKFAGILGKDSRVRNDLLDEFILLFIGLRHVMLSTKEGPDESGDACQEACAGEKALPGSGDGGGIGE